MDEEQRLNSCKKVRVQVNMLKRRKTVNLSLLLAVHSHMNLAYSLLHLIFTIFDFLSKSEIILLCVLFMI